MSPKVLLIILAVIGLLFVATVLLGRRQPQGSSADPPDWSERLGSVLIRERPLSVDDIDRESSPASPCLSQFERADSLALPAGGGCSLTIDAASFLEGMRYARRTLTLAPGSGNVTLTRRIFGDSERTESFTDDSIDLVSKTEMAFFKEGGVLSISCAALSDCLIRIVE